MSSNNLFKVSKAKDPRGDRLGEYSSLIRRMQSLQRWYDFPNK